MYLFRIHIRPQGGLANNKLSCDYCFKNNILGVGWQIEKEVSQMIDWETYEIKASEKYGKVNIVKYIKKYVAKDDLAWTRDTVGNYFLAKVIEPWEYRDNMEARDADIVNVFPVEIIKVGQIDDVPGKIISSFRAPLTIMEIPNETAINYSKQLWNELSGRSDYEAEKTLSFWDLLSDEETEDLMFIFLQNQNWYVIPNSRKKDTMAYEFYLINKTSYQRAIVQVKTGNSKIDFDLYSDYSEEVFFFQANGYFIGTILPNMKVISKETLESFIFNNRRIIPSNILRWFDKLKRE